MTLTEHIYYNAKVAIVGRSAASDIQVAMSADSQMLISVTCRQKVPKAFPGCSTIDSAFIQSKNKKSICNIHGQRGNIKSEIECDTINRKSLRPFWVPSRFLLSIYLNYIRIE